MKKTLAILVAIVMAISFTACSNIASVNNNVSGDTLLLGMEITPPEEYSSVERSIDKNTDGTINEKTLTYTLADGSKIAFSTSTEIEDKSLDELLEDSGVKDIEKREIAGKQFSVFEFGELYALCQDGAYTYGVQFTFPEEENDASDETNEAGDAEEEAKTSEVFDKALEGISFVEDTTSKENEEGLEDINYTLDETLNVVSIVDTLEETKEGDMVSKSYTWRFGTDKDNLDYRFIIRVIKNTTLDAELDESNTYTEKTVGDLTYTVREDSDGNAFEYNIQHGTDVYVIKNLGDNSGWFIDRSEESYAAFENLINSISFNQ